MNDNGAYKTVFEVTVDAHDSSILHRTFLVIVIVLFRSSLRPFSLCAWRIRQRVSLLVPPASPSIVVSHQFSESRQLCLGPLCTALWAGSDGPGWTLPTVVVGGSNRFLDRKPLPDWLPLWLPFWWKPWPLWKLPRHYTRDRTFLWRHSTETMNCSSYGIA